jgi:ATP-dependent protease ClpP protease subunit
MFIVAFFILINYASAFTLNFPFLDNILNSEPVGNEKLDAQKLGYFNPYVNKYESVLLEPDNLVVLRGEINHQSANKVVQNLLNVKNETMYLYIHTNGGSVIAGNNIVQTIDALSMSGKHIICIADVAISMGFVIFQSCPVRYIRPQSVLMQHQISIGIDGSLQNIMTHLDFIKDMEYEITVRQADRLGLTKQEFDKKILSDWWIYGPSILKHNAADKIVHVLCNFDPIEHTYEETTSMLFFEFTETYSKCPLINTPLSGKIESENGPLPQGVPGAIPIPIPTSTPAPTSNIQQLYNITH